MRGNKHNCNANSSIFTERYFLHLINFATWCSVYWKKHVIWNMINNDWLFKVISWPLLSVCCIRFILLMVRLQWLGDVPVFHVDWIQLGNQCHSPESLFNSKQSNGGKCYLPCITLEKCKAPALVLFLMLINSLNHEASDVFLYHQFIIYWKKIN